MTSTRKGNNKTQSLKEFLQFFTLCVWDKDGLSTTDICLITSTPTEVNSLRLWCAVASSSMTLYIDTKIVCLRQTFWRVCLIPTGRPSYPHRAPSALWALRSHCGVCRSKQPTAVVYRLILDGLRLWYVFASSSMAYGCGMSLPHLRWPTAVVCLCLIFDGLRLWCAVASSPR
jgi:hypothetical protein